VPSRRRRQGWIEAFNGFSFRHEVMKNMNFQRTIFRVVSMYFRDAEVSEENIASTFRTKESTNEETTGSGKMISIIFIVPSALTGFFLGVCTSHMCIKTLSVHTQ
jgi:hypothetical protein